MGRPDDALRGREASLVSRDASLADADQQLSAVLVHAHATACDALQRLAAIEDEIETAVHNQDVLALDTHAGASSFQKFLLAKQQEIRTVVADAHNEDIAQSATLRTLLAQYTG